MTSGVFITFEGIDGAGKSSHVQALADVFSAQGRAVVVTREPGGTPLAEKLRGLALNDAMDPLAEALVMFAARRDHLMQVIEPALARGDVVLCDRFTDATFAYQGGGRGFEPKLIEEIVELATGGLKPDLTLLFDLSVAESAVRTRKRVQNKRTDRLDKEDAEFHTRVREAYLQLAESEPNRIKIVNTNQPPELTHQRVKEIIIPFLKSRGHITGAVARP